MKLSKLYCSLIPRVSCVDGEKEPGTHMLCSSGISGNLGNFCKTCSVDGNVIHCWGTTAKFKFLQYFQLYGILDKMETIANQMKGTEVRNPRRSSACDCTCCHAHSVLFLPMHSLFKRFRLSCFWHSISLFACLAYCLFLPMQSSFMIF